MANMIDAVIHTAENEVGYLEKASMTNLDSKTANAGSGNYTKYWKTMCNSLQGSYWCLCFICFLYYTTFKEKIAKKLLRMESGWTYYTPTAAQNFKNHGQWHTSNPRRGDIIFFKNNVRICHVGIVYAVDKSRVYTIEGNTSSSGGSVIRNGGGVFKKSYPLSYYRIAGYGRPNYDNTVSVDIPIASISSIIKQGDKGMVVTSIQNLLNYCGYNCGIADGEAGPLFTKAVKKFQTAYGLEVDGVVGKNTMTILNQTKSRLEKTAKYGKKTSVTAYKMLSDSYVRTEPILGKKYWVKYDDIKHKPLKKQCTKDENGYAKIKKGKKFGQRRTYTDSKGNIFGSSKAGYWLPVEYKKKAKAKKIVKK